MPDQPCFKPGANIALKVPTHLLRQTISFYADVLELPLAHRQGGAIVDFGAVRLWIDGVPTMTQPELWLQVVAPDLERASQRLAAHAATRCDEIEPLPAAVNGFWVSGPGGVIHLVQQEAREPWAETAEPARPWRSHWPSDSAAATDEFDAETKG